MTSLRYPLHEGKAANPDPPYRRIRESEPTQPVVLPSGDSAVMVTRYDDVRTILSDPRFSVRLDYEGAPRLFDSSATMTAGTLMGMDPPEHTRLRRLVAKAFTARRIEAQRPRVRRNADELLSAMQAQGQPADLIESFAFPLPMRAIGELLGVPPEDSLRFRSWSNVIGTPAERTADEIGGALQTAAQHIAELLAAKRAAPADDLLSALIQARDEDRGLGEQELVSLTLILIIGGHETTVSAIGSGVALLLTHPDQLAALRGDPSLLPSAVEEILRHDGPTQQAFLRVATEDVELSGVTVHKGAAVLPVVLSANHDRERFTDPAAFDITRTDNQHLTFGHGTHFCLGAALARLETQVALAALLERLPGLRLATPAEDLPWHHLPTRGPRRLPVNW